MQSFFNFWYEKELIVSPMKGFLLLDHTPTWNIVPVSVKEKPAAYICPQEVVTSDYYSGSSFNSPQKVIICVPHRHIFCR